MPDDKWMIRGHEFVQCSCAYGCPCQFVAMPTEGYCKAVFGIEIEEGYHGETSLNGLRFAGVFAWPGAIHEGHGEATLIIDESASEAQRAALLRIAAGEDTDPGATFFNVFASTLEKVNDPVFTKVNFDVDVPARRARLEVSGRIDSRGEPIINPITGNEHRAKIELPAGFEYAVAEAGRGWTKTKGDITFELADRHAHFADLHIGEHGVIR